MNYAFLPDLLALTILIVILLVLRRRHPQKQADLWLVGLFLTLIEALAHTYYAPSGVPNRYLHLIVVDCYLLAGLVFILASGNKDVSQTVRLIYIGLNGLPLLAINSLYGLHYHSPNLYLVPVAAGLITGVATSCFRQSWLRAGLHLAGWLAMGMLIRAGDYREVVYWSLCCVYTVAAFNFQRRLPARSTGRLAIVTGFTIWALCFLLHPWVVQHYSAFADIASHVWNMQKSLISIGMILVMLEEQVSNNEWLALHDELTGLPNRRSFEDRLGCALDRSRRRDSRLAVLMLDLNGFKKINDSLGHHAGDQVLREVSKNLRDHVTTFDTLARLGGDEFTIIVSDMQDSHSLDRLMEDVRLAVERPLVVDGQSMAVTASLGFAMYPEDAEDADRLLKIADQRMYLLKQRAVQERVITEMMSNSGRLSKDTAALVASESSRRRLRHTMAEDATL